MELVWYGRSDEDEGEESLTPFQREQRRKRKEMDELEDELVAERYVGQQQQPGREGGMAWW